MSTLPQNAKEIFLEAVEKIEPTGWPSFLQGACRGNPELRHQVEELLKAHQQEDSLFDIPPTEDARRVDQPLGESIGPYKLLQKIGEGGFGVVFMAEQTRPVRRHVALKIIKPGMDSKEVIARFEAERQALAIMDHPNIAKVLDGGETEAGRPYFVMELVKGVPLTKFCDENKLDTRSRLSLFMAVCNAIQHAHQKGVIHRDIKPSNVMVTLHDGKPVPKVIDFGVSKAISQQLTARTLFTQYGQMVGTPQYMSPEQAEMSGLDIDTRSDIYSLGVLLYELLTGTTPIDPARLRNTAYAELQRMIREEEPPKPSRRLSTLGEQTAKIATNRSTDFKSLRSTIQVELDWIVMKALDKDRNRRYDTAKGFAVDVDNYLKNEPVNACPPTTAYLLRKTLQRHKVSVVVASAFLGLLMVTVIGTASGWYYEGIQAAQTDRALNEAEDAKRESEEKRQQAQTLADSLKRTLYAADMNNAMTAWEKNDLRLVKELLDKYTLRTQRGWEWHYLSNLYQQAKPKSLIVTNVSPLRVFQVPGSTRVITTHSEGNVLTLYNPDLRDPLEIQVGNLEEGTWNFSYADLSPDGSLLVHPSDDFSSVILRNTSSMIVVDEIPVPHELANSDAQITTASFSPTGQQIAISIKKVGVAIYDLSSKSFGRLIELPGIGACEAIEFTTDGAHIAVTSDPVTVWNTQDGSKVAELDGHTKEVVGLRFVNDDEWIATASRDRTLIVWDYKSEERIKTLGPFDGEVRCVAYDAESKRLAAGLRNRKLKTWVLPDFREMVELRAFNGLYALDYAPDGHLIYGAFGGGIAVDENHRLEAPSQVSVGGAVLEVAISGSGKQVVSLINENEESNAEWGKLSITGFELEQGLISPLSFEQIDFNISCLAATQSGTRNWLAIGAMDAAQLSIIDLNAHPCDVIYESNVIDTVGITTVCFSDDETSVYCGLKDGRVMELRLEDGPDIATFYDGRHSARITSIAPYGKSGCVSGAGDGSVSLWEKGRLVSNGLGIENETSKGVWIRGLDTHRGAIVYGLFGMPADGNRIFHLSKDKRKRGFYGHTFSMHDVKFIEDGETLVSLGGDRELKIWNTDNFEQRLAIRESEIFSCLAVSPDESMIAAGTRERSVFLYHAPHKEMQMQPKAD